MEASLAQANWYVLTSYLHLIPSPLLTFARQHKDPQGVDLQSIQQSTDNVVVDSANASFNPIIPANKNGKRYSMRQIFQVWYDNESTILEDVRASLKNSESYKVAKPTPMYHLVLQHAVKEAELEKDLDKAVSQLSVDEPRRTAAMPPPNLPAPALQTIPTLDPSLKLIQPSEIQWLYLDPSGNEQGPFTGDVMQEWLSEGYLNFDLRIRRSEEHQFQTLSEFCEKLQNFSFPFKVPLPEIGPVLKSASPNGPVAPSAGGSFHDANVATPLHPNGSGSTPGTSQPFQPGQNTNGSQSAFGAPLYSQLMPNGLPNGGLGAANMRMLSSSHLFDYLANNDYLLINQQQYPPANQFGIDTGINQNLGGQNLGGQNLGGQNIGGQNIGGGFGQLHMLSLLHQPMQPQPQISRTSSAWGVDSTLAGNNTGSSLNPLLSQPNPISPWLTGMQSASRVSSPFVPSSTLASEQAVKVDDHVLHDLHSSFVTGILNDDREEFAAAPAAPVAAEPELKPEAPPSEFNEEIKPVEPQVESPVVQPQEPAIPEPEPKVEQLVKAIPAPEPKAEKLTKVISEEPLQPVLAPWAASTSSTSTQPKLTLKEIQQLEAERLQKERQLRAELRQEQAQSLANSLARMSEEKSTEKLTFNWANNSAQQTTIPKTLAEIQKEEAEARAKTAKTNTTTGASVAKPSLASSLANAVPKEDFSAWTTVASKKTAPKKVATQTFTSSPVNSSLSPQMLRAASSSSIIGNSVNNNAVKEEFMVWARSAMTNLYPSVSKDDLLEIFTTLPVHNDSAQLISETIYSSSATMDGRRFAQEFMKRRQQVEKQLGHGDNGSWSSAIIASADKIPAVDDDGWSTSVKSKKKGKKN